MPSLLTSLQEDFIKFCISKKVLKFGDFTLKSGRQSPYFFTTGMFDTGADIQRLGEFYAQSIMDMQLEFDVLFGPAYKGIPLCISTTIALSQKFGRNVAYNFNRKQKKTYGDAQDTVGASITNQRVLLIDDVTTRGTAVEESLELFKTHNAKLVGVIIALDREEKGRTELGTCKEISQKHNIPVQSIIKLQHLLKYVSNNPEYQKYLPHIEEYLATYGAS